MAGGSSGRLGARILQVKNGFHGKPGRQDGKPSVVSKMLPLTGTRGHVVAALLDEGRQGQRVLREMRDGVPPLEMHSAGSGGGSSVVVTWGHLCVVEPRRSGRPGGDGYLFRGVTWADNYWLFCDDKEKLVRVVHGIQEELLDLYVEPKPEPLWWAITYKEEDETTLQVGERREK